MKRAWHVTFLCFLLAVGIMYGMLFLNGNGSILFQTLKYYALQLKAFASAHPHAALCAYMFIFIIATVLFLPITLLMTILSGFLFGGCKGALYASTAATLGGLCLFLLVRHFFRQRVQDRFGQQRDRIANAMKKHGAWYLFFLQISPVTPTFVINLTVGLLDISVWTYIWTTFLGTLPGSCIYALAGENMYAIRRVGDILSPTLFSLLLVLSLVGIGFLLYMRYKRKSKG